MGFFPAAFKFAPQTFTFLPTLLKISVIGAAYKNLVNLMSLYYSSTRIVSLDVD
jgi:hypothetical protein